MFPVISRGCLALSVFYLTEAQQKPPKCVGDMMQNPGFLECFQGFMGFIQNAAQSRSPDGATGPEPNAMMKIMCLPEGKAAMRCMMQYLKDCPEITQQAGGMDLGAFMQGDGMDAACDLLAGPCVKIVECMQKASQPGAGGDMNSMVKDMKSNPFAAFLMQTSMACGAMKAQFDCVLKHEAECGDQVKILEAEVRQHIDASLKDSNTVFASYDDVKKFMKEECETMPTKDDDTARTCVMGALSTPEFVNCYQNATDKYTMKNEGQCSLYDMQSSCLAKTVGTKCGDVNAKFMQRNMNLVIRNVPVSCTLTTDTSDANRNVQLVATTAVNTADTSGAITNVQLATTTLVMLALSAFLVM